MMSATAAGSDRNGEWLVARRAVAEPARAARAAGLTDLSTFHRAFRRRFGTTPGAVRPAGPAGLPLAEPGDGPALANGGLP